jgi:long-chain fatty acid transport protein
MNYRVSRITAALLVLFALSLSGEAEATNGMNLEGYGPIATGMGGASFAYLNGTAAMMNNPATLSLIPNGIMLDLAFGSLGPDVSAIVTTPMGSMTAESEATAFYMPAFGLFVRKENYGFGIGVFSQGGMGTEYGADSWLADPSMGANTALTGGLVNRSEVGVGRVIAPFTYDIDEQWSVGASFDFVWAGMDLQMALSEAQFQNLANPMAQTIGTASGTLVDGFGQFYEPFGGSGIATLYHAYFDFSNENSLTGEARGYGVAGKVGVVFKANEKVTLGATFHSPTFLGDLETENAELSMAVNADPGAFVGSPTGTYSDMNLPLTGTVTVKDFEWPWVIGGGVAVEPTEQILLALDVKYIAWSSVMEDFTMTFTADDSAENGGFAGLSMDAVLFQEWENQIVLSLGGAYRPIEPLTLRGGFNYGKNPVPDGFLNALFPAIVETHITFGAGYDFDEKMGLNGSFVYGFDKSQENPGNGSTIPPVESTHSQLNWMMMFSYGF